MQTNEIVREMINKINAYEGEEEAFEAIYAHEFKPEVLPIDKIYISFSTNSNAVSFFDDENEDCCRKTKVEVRADFISSPKMKISKTYALAEVLMDYLTMEYAGKLTDYEIGKADPDGDLKALRLPCVMTLVYEQCPAYNPEGAAIKPFADFFCKTHVDDDIIHLTSEEKAYIHAPFIIGYYTGDGEEVLEIELGFKPKFLVVFGTGSAGVAQVDGLSKVFFGFALGKGRATKGIEVTSTGFNVKMGDTIVAHGVYPELNRLGQSYNYIAFK